jgi:signal peptidase I
MKASRSDMKNVSRDVSMCRKATRTYKIWENLDTIKFLLIAVLAALSVRMAVVDFVRVDGTSMIPTLNDSERMMVDKLVYGFEDPQHGDIVVCRYPGYVEDCVKRVIAVAGDKVQVFDGAIYLNGELLDESAYWNDVIYGDTAEVTVPSDHVFVMGDNRNDSKDSRNPSVGCLPLRQVVGRVEAVVWPPARLSGI